MRPRLLPTARSAFGFRRIRPSFCLTDRVGRSYPQHIMKTRLSLNIGPILEDFIREQVTVETEHVLEIRDFVRANSLVKLVSRRSR